jgi:ABC-type multidrug transport system fused ATPase/permease subunit
MTTWNSVHFSYSLLDRDSRKRFLRLLFLQGCLPLFDLAGVLVLGVVTLSLTNALSQGIAVLPDRVMRQIQEVLSIETKISISLLLGLAVLLFCLKGVLAIFVVRRTYLTLAEASFQFSLKISSRFFKQTISEIQRRSTFETGDALNSACNFQIIGVLGSSSTFFGEFMLLLLLAIFMLIVNPGITLVAMVYFYLIFYFMQKRLLKISDAAGAQRASSVSENSRTVLEGVNSYREIYVGNLVESMLSKYRRSRAESVESHWKVFWVSIIPKYLFESALILGSGLLGAVLIRTTDLDTLTFTLSTFLIVGTRVLPSILRIQSASNTIAGAFGSSLFLRQLLGDVNSDENEVEMTEDSESSNRLFKPEIDIANLEFFYETKEVPAVSIDRMHVESGERIAIVGPSGAGKSTLSDLLLGVLKPQSGQILLSGNAPREAVKKWPGKVSYVPQSINLITGTIFENVALFQEFNNDNASRVWNSLERAQLSSYVMSLPEQLTTQVGERGTKLSGGQKQRIALARALYSQPELVILDEATSALDATTEDLVRIAIENLGENVTVFVIAHRLSTIKDFTRVIYMDGGKILADGSFDYVRSNVVEFDKQARISGVV